MAKNYNEIKGYGRGAGSNKPYTVAFELAVKKTDISHGINSLDEKSGLIVKNIMSKGKPLTGFINLDEIYCMKEDVLYADRMLTEIRNTPGSSSASSEYIFRAGNFKGKTPSQLLLEGVSKDLLIQQSNYLKEHATGNYAEANLKGVTDIATAIKRYEEGNLTATKSASIAVFDSGIRYFPKNERCPYETMSWTLKIICVPTDDNPFKIEWKSSDVTIDKSTETNTYVIKSARNARTESASLTRLEFMSMWNRTYEKLCLLDNEDLFDRLNYSLEHKDDYKNPQNPGASYNNTYAPLPHQTNSSPSKPSPMSGDECPFV